MNSISSNAAIAKNTAYLYFRMMFTMLVSLYTSRVNLSVLGIEDNGIYQIVGGVVALFSFLNSSLAGATSRFLTYELGKGDIKKLKDTFVTALNIHILVAIGVFILAETIGLWFLEYKLVIPASRMDAARVVYQLSILATMLSIVQVPYTASIISHERMGIFAYMSILDVILKLLICYLLYIIPFDKLVTFALLTLCVVGIVQFVYAFYCHKHFSECSIGLAKNTNIIKSMMSFSGWDLFGNFGVMARGQGVNMVLNMFFGPAINAACGFANTIGNAIYSFANNFMTAIRPPIVKAYSIGDYAKMESLMINASKYSFSLLLLLSTPFIFESGFILKVWLKTPPAFTEIFSVLELILSLCSSLFLPLIFAIHASGRIKFMSIVNGCIWIMSVPITYLMLSCGFRPVAPYIVKIGLLLLVVLSNLYSVKRLIPSFDIPLYLRKAVVPSAIMAVVTISITWCVNEMLHVHDFLRFFVTCVVSTLVTLICMYLFILSEENRNRTRLKIKTFLSKCCHE